MKILFPYMGRWRAVNWTRYHSLFNNMAEHGHEIFILEPPSLDSSETNFQEINVELHPNIHLIDVKVNKIFWNNKFILDKIVKKGVYSLVSLHVARQIVETEKIDIIFLYNIPQYPFLNIKGPIKIFDLADDYMAMLEHELGSLNNPYIMKMGNWFLDKMVRKSNITLSVSYMLANKIDKNIKVIANGVDLENVSNIKDIDFKIKKPVIGFLGSFEYFIDFDLIIESAAKLPNYTFLLVGTGREWKRVSDAVSDLGLKNVILTGGIPHNEVFSYINKMDICLNIFKKISISHNACPIKLFEYLAMKKPVISTRLDELKYINKDFIFFADTTDELVRKIKIIAEDKNLASDYAERGYNETVSHYTWNILVDNLLKTINDSKEFTSSFPSYNVSR